MTEIVLGSYAKKQLLYTLVTSSAHGQQAQLLVAKRCYLGISGLFASLSLCLCLCKSQAAGVGELEQRHHQMHTSQLTSAPQTSSFPSLFFEPHTKNHEDVRIDTTKG